MKKLLHTLLISLVVITGAFSPLLASAQFIQDGDGGSAIDASKLPQTQSTSVSASEIQLQARENARDDALQQSLGNQAPGTTPSQSLSAAANNGIKDLDLANLDFCTFRNLVTFRFLDCGAQILLKLGGKIVWAGGVLLNISIDFSILKMGAFLDKSVAINAVWKTFRDLSNLFFIFLLIWIALSTILGTAGGQTKKMVINVIIVALLINFSMFFTKVVIDASNILTVQFYQSITKGGDDLDNGISWVFMNSSRLTTIYSTVNSDRGQAFTGGNLFTLGVFGFIFSLILAFVFIMIAVLFMIRFVVFIYLIILSPLALMGYVLPKLDGKRGEWWGKLVQQAIFAPVMMMMLWAVAVTINDPTFLSALHIQNPSTSFSQAIASPTTAINNSDTVYVILNFVILIAMLIGGTLIATSMGGSGSSLAIKIAGGATFGAAGWVGRKTAGRFGSYVANTKAVKSLAASKSLFSPVGIGLLKGAKGVANSSFDLRGAGIGGAKASSTFGDAGGKGGYTGVLDEQVKKHQETAKLLEDHKIYQTDDVKKEARDAKDTGEEKDKEVLAINKQMADFTNKGGSINDQRYKNFEQAKINAIKERDAAKKKLETINKDQSKTQTGEQAYANNLTKGILGSVMSKIAAERGKAQEKIDEPYAKDRQKQEASWAEAEQIKIIEAVLADLKADRKKLEELGDGASSATKALAAFQQELVENTQKLKTLDLESTKNGVDIIKINKERGELAERTKIINENIGRVTTDKKLALSTEKESLDRRIEDANKELAIIKSKNNEKKMLQTLKKLTAEEKKEGVGAEKKEGGDKKEEPEHH